MDKPVASVIILTYNSSKKLRKCLRSLLKQTFKQAYEIIVVDDGSTDDTCKITKEMGTRLVRLRRHTGYVGLLRNIGVTKAKSDIVAFIDSDCIAKESWLEESLKYMEGELCVTGPVRNVVTSIWALPFAFREETENVHKLGVNRNGYIGRLSSGNMAIKRSTITNVGGFIPWFKRSEDTELSIRLRIQGIKMKFAPAAVVYHFPSITIRSMIIRRFYAGVNHLFIHRLYGRIFKISVSGTIVKVIKAFFRMFYVLPRKRETLVSFMTMVGNIGYLFGLLYGHLQSHNLSQNMFDTK